jgi:cyanate lyase
MLSTLVMQSPFRKHPLLGLFDHALERLSDVSPTESLACMLQLNVNSTYYHQLVQIDVDQLIKPVSPTDVMLYKDYPIVLYDGCSFFTISPRKE